MLVKIKKTPVLSQTKDFTGFRTCTKLIANNCFCQISTTIMNIDMYTFMKDVKFFDTYAISIHLY